MWEAITLTPRWLHDGQTELLFWSYGDTDVNYDPSDVWYILTKNIISIFRLTAPLSAVPKDRIQIYSLTVR